jgi:hypothetical protein
MSSKRASSKSSAPSGSGRGPFFNAVLLGAAICAGLAMLVSRGRMSWPPTQLLASLYTVAGCLALVGPIVLGRKEAGEAGLGELLWMTGGLLIWVLDAVALIRGEWRSTAWVTPLGYQAMGLTMLAMLLAGWRCGLVGWNWSWTNVTGWLLGIFWVALAVASVLPPAHSLGLAVR